MGEHVIRQKPQAMPSATEVAEALAGAATRYLVAGCRGDNRRKNHDPDPAVHGEYAFAGGKIADASGKHVVVFTHGYNVTATGALRSATDLFAKLDQGLLRDQAVLTDFLNIAFTWPGDVGTVYFNDAQDFAHHSGVALYKFLVDLIGAGAKSVSMISHSLGAHVVLRALSILGERNYRMKLKARVDRLLMLAPAVEDDVFSNPDAGNEYHFPDAAFGVRDLHMSACRDDDVLSGAFRVNEFDKALGYSGPETMTTLVSLSHRVTALLGPGETFRFEVHDFSRRSATIMNPNLFVTSHGGYWRNQDQVNYYVNLVR